MGPKYLAKAPSKDLFALLLGNKIPGLLCLPLGKREEIFTLASVAGFRADDPAP